MVCLQAGLSSNTTAMRNRPNKANSGLHPKPGLGGFNLTKTWHHQRALNYMVNCRKQDYHHPEEAKTKIGIWQNQAVPQTCL